MAQHQWYVTLTPLEDEEWSEEYDNWRLAFVCVAGMDSGHFSARGVTILKSE